MEKTKLTEKQKLFCTYYSITRNSRESAAKSGYAVFPEKTAQKLLERKGIREQIEKEDEQRKLENAEVCAGYRRLAFGSVADAVSLLFCNEQIDMKELEKMDLYNIAEIKRPRDGSLEIKFFDRLKALEKLESLNNANVSDGALPFYEAIKMGAKAVYNGHGSGADE